MDPKLLDILVCPVCKGPLVYAKAGKPDQCETAKTRLVADKDPSFTKWLAGVQCRGGQVQAR